MKKNMTQLVALKYSNHPLYSTYTGMKQRCSDPNIKLAASYYEKGISVCDRWAIKGGFLNFLADMGNKPTPGYTLERIDNSKGYSPENCRWATRLEQTYNRDVFKNNKVGITGVSWHKRVCKWVAQIRINGKKMHLGYFDTIEEAAKVYNDAANERLIS